MSDVAYKQYKDKLSALMSRYRRLMLYIAYSIIGDVSQAEDVVSDVMIKLAGNIGRVGEVDAPETKALLSVMTKNAAFDFLRKTRHSREQDVSLYDENLELLNTLAAADVQYESIIDLKNALENLSDEERDLIFLHFYQGYNFREIGGMLGEKSGTVKKRCQRILKKLKGMLG